ncbi:hypothetical protein BZA77DRAFT_98354 [Pyronema omphalodes]|nr:hypothetical protein BZA77DRAFT_98354 [Pyronema omphalodes]
MTRTAEDFMASQSPKAEMNGDSQSPPPSTGGIERRSLRQQPTPRSFYAPEATPQRASRSASQQHTPTPAANGAPQVFASGNAHHFPDFRPGINTLPTVRPVLTPRTAPGQFQNFRRRRFPDMNGMPPQNMGMRIGAGHPGAPIMHRITMSLKSEIPEDVEFSMQQLVRISYEAGDELLYQYHPALCDILFKMLREGIDRISKEGREDTIASAAYTHQLERTNGVALIIRNMAFSPNNAKQFAMIIKPKDLLLDGLRLPKYANLTELKHYLLETIEVMANSLPFLPNDNLLDVIAEQLESNDRGMLLGAMRAICRLVIGRDDYNRLGDVPFRSIQRIASILMLEDEELVSACLDFLYQYTNNEDNTARLLQHPDGIELSKQLVRLLLFQGIGGEQLVYIKNINKPRPPIHRIPHLPNEIVQELLTYSEPERATKWMRCCFEEDPEADITQIALWQAYQSRFTEHVASSGLPLLPAAEFIKNVSVAFQTASAMVLPTPSGQRFIIKGIRARETPMSTKGHVYLGCKWYNTAGVPASKCTAQHATPQDLWAHILQHHLSQPTEGSVQGRPLWCNWSGCDRFGSDGEKDRHKVIAHVRTHMPDPGYRREDEAADDPEARVIIRRCQTFTDERGEAAGIPLTSVLVLRNIGKRGGEQAKRVIKALEKDLWEVMAVNKPLAVWVADLVMGEV